MGVQVNSLLAVDLGGTKCSAAVISSAGKILHRKQETTCQAGPQEGIAQIIRLLQGVLAETGLKVSQISALGVSITALLEVETDRVIWAPHLEGWEDVALRPALEESLKIPVCLEYDGHAAVLGEWWVGSGKGYNSLVNIVVGTGIGGGMILDGKLYRGADRLAGAAGWFALTSSFDHTSERARKFGCWESLAAGPGLVQYTLELSKQHLESRLYAISQSAELTPAGIFSAAQDSDELAQQVLRQLAGWLGLGIANIVSLVNPQIVILGGGVGSHCQALLPQIRAVMKDWAQPFAARSVQVVISELGPDAGLYGAAYAAMLARNSGG